MEFSQGKLKRGMSQIEVATIVGYPDNSDREYVWIWSSAKNAKGKKWLDIYKTGPDTIYCLFYNGKLMNGILPGGHSDPWQDFAGLIPGMNLERADRLIGPRSELYKK